FHPYPWIKGGLFSVARSVALRRPGVTWQSALWSSDFPQRATPTGAPRPSRPTASQGKGIGPGRVGASLSAPAVSTGAPGWRPGGQGEALAQAEREPIRRRLGKAEREVNVAPLAENAVPERTGPLRDFVLEGPIVERQQACFSQRPVAGCVRQ